VVEEVIEIYSFDGGDFVVFDHATAAPGAPTPPIFALAIFLLTSLLKYRANN